MRKNILELLHKNRIMGYNREQNALLKQIPAKTGDFMVARKDEEEILIEPGERKIMMGV